VGVESGALYWDIGDIMIRLRAVTLLSSSGSNNLTFLYRFLFELAVSEAVITR
jgi:hypothetical protein